MIPARFELHKAELEEAYTTGPFISTSPPLPGRNSMFFPGSEVRVILPLLKVKAALLLTVKTML